METGRSSSTRSVFCCDGETRTDLETQMRGNFVVDGDDDPSDRHDDYDDDVFCRVFRYDVCVAAHTRHLRGFASASASVLLTCFFHLSYAAATAFPISPCRLLNREVSSQASCPSVPKLQSPHLLFHAGVCSDHGLIPGSVGQRSPSIFWQAFVRGSECRLRCHRLGAAHEILVLRKLCESRL